jgi:hypothetical protein
MTMHRQWWILSSALSSTGKERLLWGVGEPLRWGLCEVSMQDANPWAPVPISLLCGLARPFPLWA